jgi:hypothetical protein
VRREVRVVLRAGAEVGWTAIVSCQFVSGIMLLSHVLPKARWGGCRRAQALFWGSSLSSVWFACFWRHKGFQQILFGVKV